MNQIVILTSTINASLVVVVVMLLYQMTGFMRSATSGPRRRTNRPRHPLLEFSQIRPLPTWAEVYALGTGLLIIGVNYLWLLISHLRASEPESGLWTVYWEGLGITLFTYGLLRFSRHFLTRDQPEWARSYKQARDFRRLLSMSIIFWVGMNIWIILVVGVLKFEGATRSQVYWIRVWEVGLLAYAFGWWAIRVPGELMLWVKVLLGLLLAAFLYTLLATATTTYYSLNHPLISMAMFVMVLILFKDNLQLLSATHIAAEVIATEKDVMLMFLKQLAEDVMVDEESDDSHGAVAHDLGRVFDLTLSFTMDQTKARAGCILMRDKTGELETLVPKAVQGPFPPFQDLPIEYIATRLKHINHLLLSEKVPIDEMNIYGQILQHGELELVNDASNDPRIPQQTHSFLRIHTLLAMPLVIREKTEGILVVINKLGSDPEEQEAFSAQDASLLAATAEQAAIAINNAQLLKLQEQQKQIKKDFETARQVQQMLLPDKCPNIPGWEIRDLYKPARDIGGDYYDFVRLANGNWCIVVADVAGKGVTAALTMASLRSAVRTFADQETTARGLIERANNFLSKDIKKDMFVSMGIGVIDKSTSKITTVRAGHEPVYVVGREPERMLSFAPEGIALGMDPGPLFSEVLTEEVIEPLAGDTILFYTDGVTEAMNESLQEYTTKRLLETVKTHRTESAQAIMRAIEQDVAQFVGNAPVHDDTTLVLLQRSPPLAGASQPSGGASSAQG